MYTYICICCIFCHGASLIDIQKMQPILSNNWSNCWCNTTYLIIICFRLEMGNYSIIVITGIILLAIIDIVCFSLTSDYRNRQLSCNNWDNSMELPLVLLLKLIFHYVYSVFHNVGNNHDNCDICHGNNRITKTSISPIPISGIIPNSHKWWTWVAVSRETVWLNKGLSLTMPGDRSE